MLYTLIKFIYCNIIYTYLCMKIQAKEAFECLDADCFCFRWHTFFYVWGTYIPIISFPLLSGWFAPGICPVFLGSSEEFSWGQKGVHFFHHFGGKSSGNVNFARAREGLMSSELLGAELEQCFPLMEMDPWEAVETFFFLFTYCCLLFF